MNQSQLIRVGWLIDGTGGPIKQNRLVRIEKSIIHSIIRAENAHFDQSEVVDLSNYTLLPGFVDAHVHLFMSGTRDAAIRERQLNANYAFIKTVIADHLKQHYAHGVRAVRDGGDYGGYALRYKKERKAESAIPVQIKSAGKAWRQSGRYGKLIGRAPAEKQTLAAALKNQTKSADHVKIVQSGLNSLRHFGRVTPPQFGLRTISDAVKAAHQMNMKVMVHCNGREPVKLAIQAGCDSIEHGFFMGTDNLKRMADSGIVWTPTAITMQAYAEQLKPASREADMARRNLNHQLKQIALARQLGVVIALGTDAGSLGVHHGAALFEELNLFIQAGFTLAEAFKCATHNGAQILGLQNHGQIAVGMKASLIVFKGTPAELLQKADKSGTFSDLDDHCKRA